MTPRAEMSTLRWVPVGASACGLVLAGRIIALVYWQGPDAADLGQPGDRPIATCPGFSWLPVDRPSEPMHLFEAPDPAAGDWERARELAALGYFDLAAPQPRTGQQDHACEANDISALRREAAELLRRSPWWQRELLREELLSRRWFGPQRGERA
jgi:hypothetical protein